MGDWAYIPSTDLLFTVGDGMVSFYAEGACTDAPSDHERRTYAAAIRAVRRSGVKRGLQMPSEASQPKARKAKLNRGPTRVVLLTNMVGAGDVDEDLEKETADEVAKYGKLLKCTVKEIKGAPDKEAVRIFCHFAKIEAASKCYGTMNGRFFGGRAVKARFYDEDRFVNGDLHRNAPGKTIVLSNLVGLGEVDEDLEWETAEEMSKIGKVVKCSIDVFDDAVDEEAVQISVEFETFEDSAKALAALNGRIFGKREVTARVY